MIDFLLELALPRTDQGVTVQWLVMIPLWIVALIATRRSSREVRQLVLGLVMLNFAWFVVRVLH